MSKELNIGMKCIKFMLLVSNFMFMMIGFVLISIGSSIKAIYGDFDMFIENHVFSPAILLVVIGIIIFFVSLFGCAGAVKQSTCLVNMYALLLTMLLVMQLSAAIAAYTSRNFIPEMVNQNMYAVMQEYEEGSGTPATEGMDFLQYRLGCCGINTYVDWERYNVSIHPYYNTSWVVPQSCCVDVECNYIFDQGCYPALSYVISQCAALLGTGALCVAFVQFLGVIFAFMLAKAIRRVKTDQEVENQQRRMQAYQQFSQQKDEKPRELVFTAGENIGSSNA